MSPVSFLLPPFLPCVSGLIDSGTAKAVGTKKKDTNENYVGLRKKMPQGVRTGKAQQGLYPGLQLFW